MTTGKVKPGAIFLGLSLLAASTAPAPAQTPVWGLVSDNFTGYAEAYADENNPPVECWWWSTVNGNTSGTFGMNRGAESRHRCTLAALTCPLTGKGWVFFWIDGIGGPQVKIRWYATSTGFHNCEGRPVYTAWGVANIVAGAVVTPTNVPGGTPVTVDYLWTQWSMTSPRPEAVTEDSAQILSTSLMLNNAPLYLPGAFDLDSTATPATWGIRSLADRRGVLNTTAGAPVTVNVTGNTNAVINYPGRGTFHSDRATAEFSGEIILSLAGPPDAPPLERQLEFSLDIGSDTEASDPNADGDEVFDPGDAYLWSRSPLPPNGADGIKDDWVIFAADPDPQQPGSVNPAPTCSLLPPDVMIEDYFDMDGHDSLDFSLTQVLPPIPDGPPDQPIAGIATNCVPGGDYLVISFDDDGAGHYVGTIGLCEVPVTVQSPWLDTYGQTTRRDEVIGLNLVTLYSPVTVGGVYPIGSEQGIHQSMAPNPDTLAEEVYDDDVDSLDVNWDDPALCEYWLFSPDHEATYADPSTGAGLDPGGIYEVAPGGGLVQVVDEEVHLGVSEETDIDAFEFVYTYDPDSGGAVLTLLFSVDDDDPLVPGDESGGLDPRMIYASYLTGGYFEYVDAPLEDDVDAIAAWVTSVLPVDGACCLPGGTCMETTAVNCSTTGGDYQGNGTVCDPNPCPQPPPNDDCQDAEPVGEVTGLPFDTTPATFDGAGTCMTGPNIWYCYTASCSGLATVSLCGSNYDTKLAVYEDCVCDPLGPEIGCNDDACGLQSEITFDAIAGTEYLIEVGGWASSTGTGELTISCGCPNPCGDINGDGGIDLADFVLFASCFGQPPSVSPDCQCSDLNGDGTIDLADFVIFAGLFGTPPGTNTPPNCP